MTIADYVASLDRLLAAGRITQEKHMELIDRLNGGTQKTTEEIEQAYRDRLVQEVNGNA